MKKIINHIVVAFFLMTPIYHYSQTIAVVGDFENTPVMVDSVSLLVKNWNPDMIVTTGDNFDANYGTIDDLVGKYYSEFIYPYIGVYGTGAISNKFFPALGNHDLVLDGLTQYLNFYTLPGNERYYSVQTGNIIFYILNSNASEPDGATDTSAQAIWLQNQLAMAGNNWKIVVAHHPPYTSGPHPSTTYMQWPFDIWGADAVISGHNHFYERLYKNGVYYFVNGTGGAVLYSFNTLIPESQFQYNKSWGAMKLQPYPDSLIMDFFTYHDSLIDRVVLIKNPVGSVTDYPEISTYIFQDVVSINFSTTVQTPVNIEICDVEGRLVLKEENKCPENNVFNVNVSFLKNGIYFLKISNTGFCSSHKILINH